MANILAIIPTYNEAANLQRLCGDILALKLPIDILVIDDSSPDGTGKLAEALSHRYKEVSVIHRPARSGIGSALLLGLSQAYRQGYELALTMDADYSHHPRYIPALLEKVKECDVAIGSRYVRQGRWLGASTSRKLTSLLANLVTRSILRVRARDASGGFRIYRTRVLGRLNLQDIYSTGYSFEEEVLYRGQLAGARLGEVPIVFESRTKGESKLSFLEMLTGMVQLLRLACYRQSRPGAFVRTVEPPRLSKSDSGGIAAGERPRNHANTIGL